MKEEFKIGPVYVPYQQVATVTGINGKTDEKDSGLHFVIGRVNLFDLKPYSLTIKNIYLYGDPGVDYSIDISILFEADRENIQKYLSNSNAIKNEVDKNKEKENYKHFYFKQDFEEGLLEGIVKDFFIKRINPDKVVVNKIINSKTIDSSIKNELSTVLNELGIKLNNVYLRNIKMAKPVYNLDLQEEELLLDKADVDYLKSKKDMINNEILKLEEEKRKIETAASAEAIRPQIDDGMKLSSEQLNAINSGNSDLEMPRRSL